MNSGKNDVETLSNYKESLAFYKTALKNVDKALEEVDDKSSVVYLELQKTREKVMMYVTYYQSVIGRLEDYIQNPPSKSKTRNNCAVMGGAKRSVKTRKARKPKGFK